MNAKKTKSKNFSADELNVLLSLLEKTPILTNKCTNAVTNSAKEAAWLELGLKFNADSCGMHRDLPQIRLKWDNLKKGAKKRACMINANNKATGGGKADTIEPDTILDRTIAIIKLLNCVGPKSFFDDDIGNVVVELSKDCELVYSQDDGNQMANNPQSSFSSPPVAVEIVTDYAWKDWNPSALKTPVNSKLRCAKRKYIDNDLVKSKVRKNNSIADYYDYKLAILKKSQNDGGNLLS